MIPNVNSENIKLHNNIFSEREYKFNSEANAHESDFAKMLKSVLESSANKEYEMNPVHQRKTDLNDLISSVQNEKSQPEIRENKPSENDFEQKVKDFAQTEHKNEKLENDKQEQVHETRKPGEEGQKVLQTEKNHDTTEAKQTQNESNIEKLQTLLNQLQTSRTITADMKKQLSEVLQNLQSELKTNPNANKNAQLAANQLKNLLAVIEKTIGKENLKETVSPELLKEINAFVERMKNAKAKTQDEGTVKVTIGNIENKEKPDVVQGKMVNSGPVNQISNESQPDVKSGLSFQFSGNSESSNVKSVIRSLPTNQAPIFQEQLQGLIDKAKINIKDSQNGNLSINLYPKTLGSISVNLGLEQGVINGRFFVENDEVKQLLMENFDNIKQQLEESGVTVGEFHVNVRGQRQNAEQETEGILNYGGTASEKEVIATVYESNLQNYHDGSINIIA